MNIKQVLKKTHMDALAGPHKARHISRIKTMCAAMEGNFPSVSSLEKIQMKHVRWVIDVWFSDQGYASSTRTDYLRSLKLLIEVLGKETHWSVPLQIAPKGPGGRPRKTKVSKQRRAPASSVKMYKSTNKENLTNGDN